ncbi:HesA/MoeB/ThiF family protein [Desulfobacterales bacterium HSG2]|nr:HesA/MoeB/ThiF family protein [Desulfobacterales bacterium HSG2]
MKTLSFKEKIRYDRQIIIPEIGEEGQKKLKNASVFIAGAGGLGSVSSYYMAAAGIGFLKIVDRDHVDLSNLNRQILHRTSDIAISKAESALEKLRELNPCCHIRAVREEIRDENVLELIGDCKIIMDATDNTGTRRILNKACFLKGIPFIHGGINGFNGMVTTFVPGETSCFECLFPAKTTQRDDKVGALGPMAGLVASVQTLEAIKIILGMGGGLKGRLLYIKAADMSFREIRLERNPDCHVCGQRVKG